MLNKVTITTFPVEDDDDCHFPQCLPHQPSRSQSTNTNKSTECYKDDASLVNSSPLSNRLTDKRITESYCELRMTEM